MIPKISGNGKSFKGLATYLTRDPKANTHERVAWTHTLNLAEDDVNCAVNLMYMTAENAELLKQEAGVRAGGRPTKNPVKHVSLNWAPEENPSREHMIATGESYLKHMGWHEHQVLMVAHSDKQPHIHLMINMVHPETGLRLNESYEKRRSQAWALEYERENGRIHCEQRLKSEAEREPNMPRNIWMDFDEREQKFLRAEAKWAEIPTGDPRYYYGPEFYRLFELQKDERIAFYAQGKAEFAAVRNAVYREVREQFRANWAEYYAAERRGVDAEELRRMKQGLVADQKAILEPLRDAACDELWEIRDAQRDEMRARQSADNIELRVLQETGRDATAFFERLEERSHPATEPRHEFQDYARALLPRDAAADEVQQDEYNHTADQAVRFDPIAGLGNTLTSFGDALFFDLTSLGSAKPVPMSKEERADQFREAAENALKQQQQSDREADDTSWRERQRVFQRE